VPATAKQSIAMRLFRSLAELPDKLRGGAVSIGNFDGVHRGHARLVERLLSRAKEIGGPPVVFTFDPHPVWILRPDRAPPPLTWPERKAELLAQLGIEAVLAYPTDEPLLSLCAADFFQQIVAEGLAARAVVEGPNFHFGKDREGDPELLRKFCKEHAIMCEIVPPLTVRDEIISSSRIRGLIAAGDIDAANALLTRPYRIRGLVTHGAGRGAKIGFPTANISGVDTLLPGYGVYAARARSGKLDLPAAVNVGPNPTFGEDAFKVEAHLIGFAGNLYGSPLTLDFLARLRDIRPFGSVDELKRQLAVDVARAFEGGSRK